MNDFAATLPSHFGLAGTKTVKERGYFLCKTAQGFFKIHKTQDTHQDIYRRHRLLEQLDGLGFPWTDRIVLSVQGEPFVQLGRETYVMTRHVKGRELNPDCLQDMTLAIESLARFHMIAQGVAWDPASTISPPLSETFAKNATFLTKTARLASKNSRMSDFDVLFIKNSGQYMAKAEASIQLLARTGYPAVYAAAVAGGHLCHGELKEETMPIWDGTCYLTNFNHAAVDAQIVDLAAFLHRYARRSRREIPLAALVDMYDRVLPLPSQGTDIIAAYLAHPWQFVKIAQQYYSKKRGWTPVAMMGRMGDLLEMQALYDAYVK
jgi:CotS family spore coat protein